MNLAATMSLENKGFVNPLQGARTAMEGFRGVAEKLGGVLGVLGASFAAFKSAEGFTEGIKQAIETGKELAAQSRITGESVKDLVVLRQAYSEAGIDAGSLTTNLVMLQKALGGINDEGMPTKEVFRQLHLNMEQLKSEGAIQQFDAIAKAIGGLRDQATRTAAISQVFGRGGAQMEALFGNPAAIEEARKAVGGMAQVMQENQNLFTKVANGFEMLGVDSQKFFAGVAEKVAPLLDTVLTKINSIDFTGLGQQLGNIVAVIAQAFNQGQLGNLVGLSLKVGFEDAVNFLYKGIAGAVSIFKSPGLFATMKEGFMVLIALFSQGIENAIADSMEALNMKGKAKAERALADESGREVGMHAQLMALDAQTFSLSSLIANAQKVFNQTTGPFNSGPDRNALAKTVTDLKGAAEALRRAAEGITPKPGGTAGGGRLETVKNQTERRMIEGDRLAKIGLHVGGRGPQADYQRRVADNTSKMHINIQKLVELTMQRNHMNNFPLGGVWAG